MEQTGLENPTCAGCGANWELLWCSHMLIYFSVWGPAGGVHWDSSSSVVLFPYHDCVSVITVKAVTQTGLRLSSHWTQLRAWSSQGLDLGPHTFKAGASGWKPLSIPNVQYLEVLCIEQVLQGMISPDFVSGTLTLILEMSHFIAESV